MRGIVKARMTCPDLPGAEIYVPQAVVSGHQQMGWVLDDSQPEETEPAPVEPASTTTSEASEPPNSAAPTRRASSPVTGKE